jgi:4-hydroxybenzoate polyprenyltransferase
MSSLRPWFHMLRIPQWSKNAVVFAALVFGDPEVNQPVLRSMIAFVAFCAVSSAGYIFNDWLDIDRDRIHPGKRSRPMATGAVSPALGLSVAGLLVVAALVVSWLVNPALTLVLASYSILMAAYSLHLKHIILVDVFIIAVGFLLRAVAGAAAVEVPVSPWLMLCTLLLALFLAFGKRRSELLRLGENAGSHRAVLDGYSILVLDQFLVITATCSIMAYSIYSFTSESVPGNGIMMLTVPPVMFAVFRYLLLVLRRGEGGAPELLLWRDTPLLLAVVTWSLAVLGVMYLA